MYDFKQKKIIQVHFLPNESENTQKYLLPLEIIAHLLHLSFPITFNHKWILTTDLTSQLMCSFLISIQINNSSHIP